MDYAQAIELLLTHADFERSGRFTERPDIAPMFRILAYLHNPQNGRRTVHIAGSKGKGSTAAIIESILRHAGYRTGLYSSPHLHSYCERIRIDGEPVSEEEFASLAEAVTAAAGAIAPHLEQRRFITFDLLTAMGFLAFARNQVDVQVVEVGLGGRLDSTNVFSTPDVCVITPISLEHTEILGDTIAAIAREKAGIIRPASHVVLAQQEHASAKDVVREVAAARKAALVDVAAGYHISTAESALDGQVFMLDRPAGPPLNLRLPLLGRHQQENAAAAVAAVEALSLGISEESLADGLSNVRWPGRLEILSRDPIFIADGAHNADSAMRLRESLSDLFPNGRFVFIVGAGADKDIDGMARELSGIASAVIATRSRHPRSLQPSQIASAFQSFGCRPSEEASVSAAIDSALALAGRETVICLLGSLFLVAEAREHFRREFCHEES